MRHNAVMLAINRSSGERPGTKRGLHVPLAPFMLSASLVLSARGAKGQTEVGQPIALRTAVKLALQHNPDLASAVADVSIADASVEAARSLDDPVLEAQLNWARRRQDVVLSPLRQPSSDDVSGSLSLTKPLSTGGALGLRLRNQYGRIEFAPPNASTPELQTAEAYTPSLELTVEHPLLRGAGKNVARAAQRLSAMTRSEAGSLRESAVLTLVRDIVRAYSDLAFAAQRVDIQREAEADARDQLERVLAEIQVGKQPPSGSAEVRVALGQRKEAVLLASQGQIERSLDLARLIGGGIDSRSSSLVALDELPMVEPALSLEETLALANAHNPQLAAARARRDQALVAIEVSEDRALPQLDLGLAGGPLGYSGAFNAAYDDLARLQGYSLTAGVTFSEPIGRHAAAGARMAAEKSKVKTERAIEALEQQIAATAVAELAAMTTARQRSELLSSIIDDAGLDLEAERARFESGRSTNFDVLRRQQQLAQTKLSAMEARLDYAKSKANIDALTGTLLHQYGVVIR